MGVPKLWAFVAQLNSGTTRSFACHSDWEGDTSDWTRLIFDGPSFAYWFWRESALKQGTYLPCRRLDLLTWTR